MPLLVLKLYALINNPTHDLILVSVDASALCATLMVLLGTYTRLGLDELSTVTKSTWNRMVGICCYAGSIGFLTLLLVDLSHAYSEVEYSTIVFAFFFIWPAYGVVAIGSAFFRQGPAGAKYPTNLALTKDVAYAGLDIFSKAVFAWHTSSAVFGKSVLAS